MPASQPESLYTALHASIVSSGFAIWRDDSNEICDLSAAVAPTASVFVVVLGAVASMHPT